eukprot:2330714-Pyramimonas_sp.AAC.1
MLPVKLPGKVGPGWTHGRSACHTPHPWIRISRESCEPDVHLGFQSTKGSVVSVQAKHHASQA